MNDTKPLPKGKFREGVDEALLRTMGAIRQGTLLLKKGRAASSSMVERARAAIVEKEAEEKGDAGDHH